ncbi:MAG: class I SAM-dependent rRNA methyltransferase [Acidiferrobacterales bacterium]
MTFAPLRLKKNEDRRLRAGHVWVYSNEVDTAATPLAEFQPGQPVVIEDHSGRPLGSGYVNPRTLISARLVSRDSTQSLTQSLLVHRLNVCYSLREKLFGKPYYRLAFGDSDGLPGLVVDRYGDVVVVQITTAGMERLRHEVVAAIDKVLRPRAILLRNDGASREIEGLDSYVESALGEVPERVAIEENGVRFEVPVLAGQKTGWFYDQRLNRARLPGYVSGGRVLDVFSYIGAWGVQAAATGAARVLCIESSARAVDWARSNAAINGVEDKLALMHEDAFEALRLLRAEREHFDVVIVDPPAFIKRKKDSREGMQAYYRLNQMAMQVLAKDGILVSASCSYHLARSDLQQILLQSSRHLDRFLQLVEQGGQAPDHPVHPAIPETSYLKVFFSRILPN